ncbi:MAG: hypothetical protein AVDCRST_MAG87-2566 [uncultured Thermomicrobiales bacterium]|uniref:Uncharacterized protein n=1 Tax=uncultured Thermomicrobiales bacterium TaxID=1645740 RepID=A0A6J4VB86_9BACT|nr:MAG: hypothetical protein AVDCRST_MAG87-2566 [uncultured Thermomicrobiales bacterium]
MGRRQRRSARPWNRDLGAPWILRGEPSIIVYRSGIAWIASTVNPARTEPFRLDLGQSLT